METKEIKKAEQGWCRQGNTDSRTRGSKQNPEDCKAALSFNEAGIAIEVYDIKKLLGAILRGERGATYSLIQPNIMEISKIAREYNCKPGDIVVAGARVADEN